MRLAHASGVPVIPIGLWGTEKVWPRSSRVPNMTNVLSPPTVTIRVGRPVELAYEDVDADTTAMMAAITALLPPEARRPRPDARGARPDDASRTRRDRPGSRGRSPARHRLTPSTRRELEGRRRGRGTIGHARPGRVRPVRGRRGRSLARYPHRDAPRLGIDRGVGVRRRGAGLRRVGVDRSTHGESGPVAAAGRRGGARRRGRDVGPHRRRDRPTRRARLGPPRTVRGDHHRGGGSRTPPTRSRPVRRHLRARAPLRSPDRHDDALRIPARHVGLRRTERAGGAPVVDRRRACGSRSGDWSRSGWPSDAGATRRCSSAPRCR